MNKNVIIFFKQGNFRENGLENQAKDAKVS